MATLYREPEILSDAAQQLAWQLIQNAQDSGEPLQSGKSNYLREMRKQYGERYPAVAVLQEAAMVFDQNVKWFIEAGPKGERKIGAEIAT